MQTAGPSNFKLGKSRNHLTLGAKSIGSFNTFDIYSNATADMNDFFQKRLKL